MKKLILLPFFASILVSCAGSPVHTSGMNSVAIQSVDNYTLCKAYTPREYYSPSATVRNEVRRRGLNCAGIYSYAGTGALDAAVGVLQGVQAQQGRTSAPSLRPAAFFKSSYISGFNKVCTYTRNGSDEAYTLRSTAICPQTMP